MSPPGRLTGDGACAPHEDAALRLPPAPPAPPVAARLQVLDLARFLAALAVMAFHYGFNGIANGKLSSLSHHPAIAPWAQYGFLGVEFFFMISGYVIFFSAEGKTAGRFLASRAVRLFPAYWVALLCTAALASVWGGPLMGVTGPQVLANLTMVPGWWGQADVDGVYWTLRYEWSFYALVFVCLLVQSPRLLHGGLLLWPAYVALAHGMGWGHAPFAGAPYACFAAGALFALHQRQPWAVVRLALVGASAVLLALLVHKADAMTAQKGVPYSPWVLGLAGVGMLAFFASLAHPRVAACRVPGAAWLGGLTYPLYLVHAHVGYMLLSHWAEPGQALPAALHVGVARRGARLWHALFSRLLVPPCDALQAALARAWPRGG